MIELKWHTGEEMLFPYIFLRDSCQCESCFHPFTKARLVLMKDLKVDSFPTELQVVKFQRILFTFVVILYLWQNLFLSRLLILQEKELCLSLCRSTMKTSN